MTKADIKIDLVILREYCKGKNKQSYHLSNEIGDYQHGRADAYEDLIYRLDELIDKAFE